MRSRTRVLVTGAGGFIGNHLVRFLKQKGYWVRGVDLRHPGFSSTEADEFKLRDLRRMEDCLESTEFIDEVYSFASDMGGIGFISSHQAEMLYNNSLIDINMLEASRLNGVNRLLYASSACIYPEPEHTDSGPAPLREEDAYPACPLEAYGWEKLFAERLCQSYRSDYSIETRIVRFLNIFGTEDIWDGGREKAVAAVCRKIAQAKLSGDPRIEIWGDGEQCRSFCYIDDCLTGTYKLMRSDHAEPINLGQDRRVTINELVDIISEIAKVHVVKKYVPGPQGARSRSSDNSRLRQVLGWEPQVALETGLALTYQWIEEQVGKAR